MFLPKETDAVLDRRSLLPRLDCKESCPERRGVAAAAAAAALTAAAASMLCLHASLRWMVIGWPLLSIRLATLTVSPKKQ
jgi:hypothetical protein